MDFVEADSIDSQNLTAEPATTSKSPLASRLNGESLVHSHNKHRCEHVKDGGLNGSTQGEANGQTQSRDFLRRNSKMKRLFNKTNTEEIIDSEHPASTETQDGFLGETTAAFNEARPGTSTLLNNLPVDDKKLLTDIKENTSHEKHVQERQAAQEGATAAQSPPSLRDIIKETVCRLNKRLSDESTEEEEEDQCRICHGVNTSPENPLVSPCKCRGSVHYLHLDCLKQWTRSRIERGTGPYTVTTCELCKGWLKLDPKLLDFNKTLPKMKLNYMWDGSLPNKDETQREDELDCMKTAEKTLNTTTNCNHAEFLILPSLWVANI
ncbi:hypothetical protein F7725_014554 [Dissostichus mawsoni]|uniref:RING-type E3 ubiquitin transferase n=1 Tax=Dissostichus mawsoni TaxID=36200 RepID=A0A7J5YWS1_DISMA|nr:hypothetical protein F7725_014554 [Dissostichus mawsoni]